jgi:hypothetical protein
VHITNRSFRPDVVRVTSLLERHSVRCVWAGFGVGGLQAPDHRLVSWLAVDPQGRAHTANDTSLHRQLLSASHQACICSNNSTTWPQVLTHPSIAVSSNKHTHTRNTHVQPSK